MMRKRCSIIIKFCKHLESAKCIHCFLAKKLIEILAAAGVNHIIIDNEHTYTTMEQTINMVRTCDSVGVAASVRIPTVLEDSIKKVLDMGGSGIVLPNVSTPEQVYGLLKYAKHAPEGKSRITVCPKNG